MYSITTKNGRAVESSFSKNIQFSHATQGIHHVSLFLVSTTPLSKYLSQERPYLQKSGISFGGKDANSAPATAAAAAATPLLSWRITGMEAKDRHRDLYLCGKKDGSRKNVRKPGGIRARNQKQQADDSMTRRNSRCSREKESKTRIRSQEELFPFFGDHCSCLSFSFCYAVRCSPLDGRKTCVDASGGPPRSQPGPMHPSRYGERIF